MVIIDEIVQAGKQRVCRLAELVGCSKGSFAFQEYEP